MGRISLRHLEVVAIAGLLLISWCVLGGADFFRFLFVFFSFERTRPAAMFRNSCGWAFAATVHRTYEYTIQKSSTIVNAACGANKYGLHRLSHSSRHTCVFKLNAMCTCRSQSVVPALVIGKVTSLVHRYYSYVQLSKLVFRRGLVHQHLKTPRC